MNNTFTIQRKYYRREAKEMSKLASIGYQDIFNLKSSYPSNLKYDRGPHF
jgi:hypothetical protein